MAAARYHEELILSLHNNSQGKRISMAGAKIVDEYFSSWLDNQARVNPDELHHVYEWGKTGDKKSRLFDCKTTYAGGNPVLNFYLTESKEPNEEGYVFSQKAFVMELGESVTIEPKSSEVLVFEIDGEEVFTPNEVHIDSPGGQAVAGSFVKKFNEFMIHEAEKTLDFMGFGRTIGLGIQKESSRTLSRMFGDKVINSRFDARSSAENIANSVEALGNDLR